MTSQWITRAVVFTLLTTMSAGAVAAVSFAPFVNVPLGPPGCIPDLSCSSGALDVVAGDFDGDGSIDIASANNASSDISIFLGDGAGHLTSSFTAPAMSYPAGIATADVNADTILDLVISEELSSTIGIYLGRGDGTFDPEYQYPMGSSPQGVILADLDADGAVDVATADLFANTVSVRLGHGDGTFGDRHTTAVPGDPFGLAAARLDGGSTLDLLVSLYTPAKVVALLGDGLGMFNPAVPATVDDDPRGLAIADFDDDGIADVAVTCEVHDVLDVLRGNGDGTFQTAVAYPVGGFPESVVAADFNVDGIVDLAVADSFGNLDFDGTVAVLVGDGTGAFQPAQQFAVDIGPYGLTAADLDGDSRPDVVTANIDSTTLSVLLNETTTSPVPTRTANMAPPTPTPTQPFACPATPQPACHTPSAGGKAKLVLRASSARRRARLSWRWKNPSPSTPADYGDPIAATDFAFCTYDENGLLSARVLAASVPHTPACAPDQACWRPFSGLGFRYRDESGTRAGIHAMTLKASHRGAVIRIDADGPALPLPALPLAQDAAVTTQLIASDGACWSASFTAPAQANTQHAFRDTVR